MSAVLGRAVQGLICGLQVKETWALLMKSGQAVIESLSVYTLLAAWLQECQIKTKTVH